MDRRELLLNTRAVAAAATKARPPAASCCTKASPPWSLIFIPAALSLRAHSSARLLGQMTMPRSVFKMRNRKGERSLTLNAQNALRATPLAKVKAWLQAETLAGCGKAPSDMSRQDAPAARRTSGRALELFCVRKCRADRGAPNKCTEMHQFVW